MLWQAIKKIKKVNFSFTGKKTKTRISPLFFRIVQMWRRTFLFPSRYRNTPPNFVTFIAKHPVFDMLVSFFLFLFLNWSNRLFICVKLMLEYVSMKRTYDVSNLMTVSFVFQIKRNISLNVCLYLTPLWIWTSTR